MNKDILQLNKQTGCYEGTLLVRVDPEIFRRFLMNAIEEDGAADLTDPSVWTQAIAKVGKIENWLGRPHVTLTPIAREVTESASSVKAEAAPPVVKHMFRTIDPNRPSYVKIEADLRERARKVPPYLWETLRAPIPAGVKAENPEKQKVYYIRSDQGRALKVLRAEWEAGTYILDPDAAHQQEEHDRQEESKVTTKIEAVATVVNGARLR